MTGDPTDKPEGYDEFLRSVVNTIDRARWQNSKNELLAGVARCILDLALNLVLVGTDVLIQRDKDLRVDLLIHEPSLRCLVVVDLHRHEDVGSKKVLRNLMNWELLTVDGAKRDHVHAPTIGLILIRKEGHFVGEYTTRTSASDLNANFTRYLDAELAEKLPAIEELEERLQGLAV